MPQAILIAVVLLIGLLLSTEAPAANYFLNASGPLGDGSGTSPRNAADASSPDKYRAIIQAQNAPGTVIVYAPGTYRMNPAFPMFDGVTHQGSGIDSTIIKIADGAASGSFTPMWLAEKGAISGFKFLDATIDFNSDKTAWWTEGKGGSIAFAFSTADHCVLQRIRFIHMGARKQEAFPIFFVVSTSTPGNLHDNLIDSCLFAEPVAKGNRDGGLTCIMMADAEPGITVDDTNVATHCQFLRLKAPEYSDLPYAQCCTCPVARDNTAVGVDSFWFIEPGTQTIGNNVYFKGQTVEVTGNTLVDSGAVASILMHANGNFAANLNVQKNSVGMAQHPYFLQGPRGPNGVTIEQYEPGNPPVGNITVQDNAFTAPRPVEVSPFAVSACPAAGSGRYFHMASLSVRNNTFVNFPRDGHELHVTTDPAYNPNYTTSGNIFSPR